PVEQFDEVVGLQQVDVVDPEPIERVPDLFACPGVVALASLRGQEDLRAVLLQPRREPKLGVAVRRCRVDVVDAMAEHRRERHVGLPLGYTASAAAPKMVRELSCPVRPNGALAIIRRAYLGGNERRLSLLD